MKDVFFMSVFFLVFAFFVFFAPNILGHPDNYIPANPIVTPEHIVPEWYFLPFYAILRAIPDKLGGVVAMVSAIAILGLLPWLDRSKIRSCIFRPMHRQWFIIFVLNFFLLMYIGAMPATGIYVTLGQIGTAYWFAYFLLIVPINSIFEKPKPMPKSIHEYLEWKKQGKIKNVFKWMK
jgi:ubiquinol-cytochrome c reductase cytochrome b subunit